MIYGRTKGYAFCHDERNGQEVWRTKLETHSFFNVASLSDVAVIFSNDVLIAASVGHMWGLQSATGAILWHSDLPGMGNRFVTLCTPTSSIQYLHTESTTTHTSS